MAQSAGGEHHVQVQLIGAHGPGRSNAPAAPEKELNRFVRSVALIERVGNALGTLAFTWATVVLLGGYPTVLGSDDFWFATTIVFLEATRMFTPNNKLDYQLFFRTRGAFRPLGWDGLLIAVVYFLDVVMLVLKYYFNYDGGGFVPLYLSLAILLVISQSLSPRALRILKCNSLHRVMSLWSPMIAVLLMFPSIFILGNSTTKWMAYMVLFVSVLLVTISKMQLKCIVKLLDSDSGRQIVFWRRVILNLCLLAAVVILVCIAPEANFTINAVIWALVVVSFGNLQIPAAAVRVALTLLRLVPQDYGEDNQPEKANLTRTLNIFYGMVLGQGILYIMACMLEVFSFIPRRFLIRSTGFRGQKGVEFVNLYYAYAFDKCMEGSVLARKKSNLITFAMDSLGSDSPKMQLYGVLMLHSLLERELTKARLLPKLTSSAKTIAKLINMLDWTSPNYTTVRLFAAKIIAELAKNLRVVTIPGAMQLVSALLDDGNKQKRGNPLLGTDDEQEERQDPLLDAAANQNQRHDQIPHTDYLLETPTQSARQVGTPAQNYCLLSCWQRISEVWSIPKEQPLTDQDLLPALGMSIIDNLAGCDLRNCVEISKTTYLIPKIIGFTSYTHDTTNTDAQQKVLIKSSLKVLQTLTSIDGKIGIILRHNISKHPFLLRNLTEILEDSRRIHELRKLVARILRNLAVGEDTRQEIGSIQLIMSLLMQAFLNIDGSLSTDDDGLLRKAAGQALAMLAMENVHNCLVMLNEPRCQFTRELVVMIQDDRYRYVASSLLHNLCLHAREKLSTLDLIELSHSLREVLDRIMNEEETVELEALIGLSSQLCSIVHEDFGRELEDGQTKERFVKRLVEVLHSNMKPTVDCPGIRRVIVQQVIYMMEKNSCYASCFNECGMMEALSVVEGTLLKVENYRLFLGNAGLMEYRIPLSNLVARAKELLRYVT